MRILECSADGPPPKSARDATDLISAAWTQKAALMVIPAARLGGEFFRLKTGIAGEIVQKFVAYGLRLAIVGDIARHLESSGALRDFVYESNRGTQVWFLPDRASLADQLQALQSRGEHG